MSEGNNTLKYIGIGCAVIAVLSACGVTACFACGAGGIGAIFAASEAPAAEARAFFDDARAGRHDEALARTAEPYRSTHSGADLAAALASAPALAQSTDQTFSQRNMQPGVTTLGGTRSGPSGTVPVNIVLNQVGERWYVTSLTVSGVPVVP